MKALAVSYITGEEGLEPPSTVLETAALPLNYSPICQYSIMTDNFYSLSRFAVFVNIFLPIFMPDFYDFYVLIFMSDFHNNDFMTNP